MSKKFLIVLLFLVTLIGIQSKAQFHYCSYGEHTMRKESKSIVVHSVNMNAGLYSPKMDYWNDTYLPAFGSSVELGSNLVFGGNITFNVASQFRTRLAVSYWSDLVEEQGVGFNELEVSFTRFSLGFFYVPYFASFGKGFQVYGGLEGFYYDINNRLEMRSAEDVVTSEDHNGHDVSFAPVIGIDKVFGNHLLMGVEFSYMIGEYSQSVVVESQTNKVSIEGPQLTLLVGYRF